jgi:hypothetical protein
LTQLVPERACLRLRKMFRSKFGFFVKVQDGSAGCSRTQSASRLEATIKQQNEHARDAFARQFGNNGYSGRASAEDGWQAKAVGKVYHRMLVVQDGKPLRVGQFMSWGYNVGNFRRGEKWKRCASCPHGIDKSVGLA